MQDTVVRDALLRHAADEPPMTFTSADMIRAGRRSRRLRVAGGIAGSAVALAVVIGTGIAAIAPERAVPATPHGVPAGTTVWTYLDAAPFCGMAATPATPTMEPTTVVNPKNGFAIPIPTEPVDHASARFSCYLMALTKQLPGAMFARDPTTPADTVPLQVYAARAFDPSDPLETAPPFYAASAVIYDEHGVGQVGFAIGPAAQSATEAAANCTGPMCTLRYGPHGEIVTVLTVSSDTGYLLVNINVYRGQTVTFASAENGVPTATAPGQVGVITDGMSPEVGRADLPISVDQLIAILAAPELTLFPLS